MRKLILKVLLVLLFTAQGCTYTFRVSLWNNTASEIGMVWENKIVKLSPGTKHRLPTELTFDSHSATNYSAILIIDNKRFGFNIPDALLSEGPSRSRFMYVEFFLSINKDGNVYLCDPYSKPGKVVMAEQPQGFPIKPVPLD
jgi:hypothetical protein